MKYILGKKVRFRNGKEGIIVSEYSDKYNSVLIQYDDWFTRVKLEDIDYEFIKERVEINAILKGKIISSVSFDKRYIKQDKLNVLGKAIERLMNEVKIKRKNIDDIKVKYTPEKWVKFKLD